MDDDKSRASRWSDQRNDCYLKQELAGRDLPHNINLTFAMVLIELSRVLDTNFYKQSPKRSSRATGRDAIVRTLLRSSAIFASHLNYLPPAPPWLRPPPWCGGIVCWNYEKTFRRSRSPTPKISTRRDGHELPWTSSCALWLLNFAAQQFKEPLAPPGWQGSRGHLSRTRRIPTSGMTLPTWRTGAVRRQQPLRRLGNHGPCGLEIYQTCHTCRFVSSTARSPISISAITRPFSQTRNLRHNRSCDLQG